LCLGRGFGRPGFKTGGRVDSHVDPLIFRAHGAFTTLWVENGHRG